MATTKLDQLQEMEWFAGRVHDRRYVFSERTIRALMSGQPPTGDNSLRLTPTLENGTGETCATRYFCGGAMKQISVGAFDYRLEGHLCVIKKTPTAYLWNAERNISTSKWNTA